MDIRVPRRLRRPRVEFVRSSVRIMKAVRRDRTVPLIAACLLVLAGCGSTDSSRGVTSELVDSTTFTSLSTETSSTQANSESSSTDTPAPTGTLTLVYSVDGPAGSAEQAVTDVNDRVAVMGLRAEVGSTDAGIEVVVRGVAADEEQLIGASIDSLGATVQIRPVLSGCFMLGQPTSTGNETTTSYVEVFGVPQQQSNPSVTQILAIAGLGRPQVCEVGPSLATGAIFDAAEVQQDPAAGLVVLAGLRPGADGEDVWNTAAKACFERAATCPSQQLAMEVDGVLVSVATVQTPEFFGSIQISGSFDRSSAAALADTLSRDPTGYSLRLTSSEFAG